jgi:putative membrane protein
MTHSCGMMIQSWWLVGILMIVITTAVLAAAIWAIQRVSMGTRGSVDARRVLEERFARGEIDEDEFRRRLDVLERR